MSEQDKKRCEWCLGHPLYNLYHDREWGVPSHDDRYLFEMLILEGAQAGLNWLSILKKRDNYRKAYDNFDPKKVAKYNEKKLIDLQHNKGIVRNRLKIDSSVENAKRFLKVQKEFGSFDEYIWQFVNGKPIINNFSRLREIPVVTKESEAMSKDLKKRGFKFVGPKICYSFMQAVGMVNDHLTYCFRYEELGGEK